MSTLPVKFYHSQMSGAPVLNGVAGSLIAILDACLVDGFDQKSADSITISGGVATVTISAGHSYLAVQPIAITANSLPAINGEKRVISATTTQLTFDATGIADQTVTGTITVKRPSAGWQKVYSGTNLAVYRSQDPTSTRMYLRVDDTNGQSGRVIGYESMSDINTNSGAGFGFPAPYHSSGGGYWPKANSTTTTWRAWSIFADAKRFWIHMHTASSSQGVAGCVWGFGDIKPVKYGDPYSAFLQCAVSDISTTTGLSSHSVDYCGPSTNHAGTFMPRPSTGVGGVVDARHACESMTTGTGASGSGLSSFFPYYPNAADNGVYFTKKVVVDPSLGLRGHLPGILIPLQNCHNAFVWRDIMDWQGEYGNRKLMAVKGGGAATSSSTGVMFFDITGPWE